MRVMARVLVLLALSSAGLWGCLQPTVEVPPGPLASVAQTFGIPVIGETTGRVVQIGDIGDQPWSLYLEVSRAAGFEFAPLEGRSAELWSAPIRAGEPGSVLYVLVVDGRAVGAWAAGEQVSGVWAVNETP